VSATSRLPEVPLEAGTLVLGDLHLDVSPQASPPEAFAAWLGALEEVPRLVVLGDLFDAWAGAAQLRLRAARAVCDLLRERTRVGTALEVLHGNRDFLLDGEFARATGARLHPHGFVGLLPGSLPVRALFLHGDELCTRDHAYQRLKLVLRSRPVRWLSACLPGALAVGAAGRLRATSMRAIAAKPAAAKEQQEEAARDLARAHRCTELVCGHSHRFRDQPLPGGPRWRVVDAFGHGRDLLRVGSGGEFEPSVSSGTRPGWLSAALSSPGTGLGG